MAFPRGECSPRRRGVALSVVQASRAAQRTTSSAAVYRHARSGIERASSDAAVRPCRSPRLAPRSSTSTGDSDDLKPPSGLLLALGRAAAGWPPLVSPGLARAGQGAMAAAHAVLVLPGFVPATAALASCAAFAQRGLRRAALTPRPQHRPARGRMGCCSPRACARGQAPRRQGQPGGLVARRRHGTRPWRCARLNSCAAWSPWARPRRRAARHQRLAPVRGHQLGAADDPRLEEAPRRRAARADDVHPQQDRRHRELAHQPAADHDCAENIEVSASHFGMGANPAVLWAIADRLAQFEGAWHWPTPAPVAGCSSAIRGGAVWRIGLRLGPFFSSAWY